MNMEYSEAEPITSTKLNPEFSQSLWYDSTNNILTRELIRRKLAEFLHGKISERTVRGEREIRRGRQILIGSRSLIPVQSIMGKMNLAELSRLHKQIRAAGAANEQEALSNKQIDLIVTAIKEALNSGEISEEDINGVKKLLS
jgi:hypothetical protein